MTVTFQHRQASFEWHFLICCLKEQMTRVLQRTALCDLVYLWLFVQSKTTVFMAFENHGFYAALSRRPTPIAGRPLLRVCIPRGGRQTPASTLRGREGEFD